MTSSIRLTRRTLAAVAATLASIVALSGCAGAAPSGDASVGAGTASGAALLPPAEGSIEYPLTLETPFGETVLEERPERIAIVTASTVDTDALIALGGSPVFAPSTVERNLWLEPSTLSGIETLWESEAQAEVSIEKVAAADPDLIVSLYAYDSFDQGRFDQLSTIAPVLYAAADTLSWQQMTRQLGETLDLSGAADEVGASAEQTIADTRAAHPEFEGRTAAHVIVYEEEWGTAYVSAPGTDTAALFEELGFSLPASAERFADDDLVSPELIGLIDADFLLVSTFDEGTEDYMVDSALFQAVPAVAEGRAVFNPGDQETGINSFAWGLNVQSALSVPWLIEQLAAFGTEAIG